MNDLKIKTITLICLPIFGYILLAGASAEAQMNTFEAGLDITSEYKDNILFTRINPKSDFFTTIGPSIGFNYITESMSLNSTAAVEVIRYLEHSEEDRENQDYSLNSNFKISERATLSGGISFQDDMTLEGELIETGEVSAWQKRRQYIGEAGAGWMFSELSKIGIDYNYIKKEFERTDSINYDRHSVSLTYSRYMNRGLDTISLAPNYDYRDSVASRLNNYSLSVAWNHAFSETTMMNISAGGRYTEEDFGNGLIMDDSGWIGSISIKRKTETTTTELGYARSLYTNVTGGESEVDQLFLSFYKMVFSRFRVGLDGRLYLRRWLYSYAGYGSVDYRYTYYQAGPTLSYNLTENHDLLFRYRYAGVSESYGDHDMDKEQKAFWLILRLRYNKSFQL